MLSEIKPKLNPIIESVAKPFSFIHPNILTILGLMFPIGFLWAMIMGNYLFAFLMLIGSVFDTLDGAVARLTNRVTRFGALLDSTMDRVSDALIIIGFYFAGLVRIEIIFAVLITSYLISYIRSRAELASKGEFVLNVGIIERTERILFFGLGLIIGSFPAYTIPYLECTLTETIFLVLLILSFITVLQRLFISAQRLGQIQTTTTTP